MALELVDTRGGVLRRIRDALVKPRASVEPGSFSGADYHVIRAPCRDGEPDWREIAEIAGSMAGRMLLPDDTDPPDDCGIRRLECPMFERKVLLATACELIDRSRVQMYRRVLGLIDPGADFTGMLPKLLRHYTSIRVLTEKHELYSDAAERMMEEYGAPVQICDTGSALNDCVLILAPGESMGGPFRSPVLACGNFDAGRGCHLITSLQIDIDKAVADVCPDGIDVGKFAAALHDCCGIEPDSYAAVSMRSGYRMARLGEVARQLAHRAESFADLV